MIIEELFPLRCSHEELVQFLDRSRAQAAGWISFYWGKTPQEYAQRDSRHDQRIRRWLEMFARAGSVALQP